LQAMQLQVLHQAMKDRFLQWLMDVACKASLLRIPGSGRLYQWLGWQWSLECERLQARICAHVGHDGIQESDVRACRNCHQVLKATDPVRSLTLNLTIDDRLFP
jgi:hypothetical protein